MAWDTGSPVSNTPTDYICDRIKNNIGIGSAPLRNWSFVENVPAGAGVAEVQQLVLSTWGTGDTFRITFNGHETTDISYNATGATVATAIAAALNALTDFNTTNKNVTCTYVSGSTWNISSANTTKWFGVAFSIVGSFSVTNAVGCSGSFSQSTAPTLGSGSANYSADVFKCSGSGDDANDAAQDFYMILVRDVTASATAFNMVVCLDWSTDYHKGAKILDAHAGATVGYPGVDANGWTDGHDPIGYWNITFMISYSLTFAVTLNKTGFTYQIKMTKNFIMISTRVGTTESASYLGWMDSLVVQTDTYPIVFVTNIVMATGVYGGFLNLPGLSGALGGVAYSFGATPVGWTMGTNIAVSNATNYYDRWANSGIWVSRVCMVHQVAQANQYTYGKLRGLLKSEVLCVTKSGTTVLIGDTMSIDGTTYTAMGDLGSNAVTAFVQAN